MNMAPYDTTGRPTDEGKAFVADFVRDIAPVFAEFSRHGINHLEFNGIALMAIHGASYPAFLPSAATHQTAAFVQLTSISEKHITRGASLGWPRPVVRDLLAAFLPGAWAPEAMELLLKYV